MAELSQTEWARRYWVHVVILALATAGSTYAVTDAFLIAPKRDRIADLERTVAQVEAKLAALVAPVQPPEGPVAIEEKGVLEQSSVSTMDGRCNIFVKRVSSSAVGFTVTVDSQKPVDYDVVAVGSRVAVDAGDKVYFIDVHRTRGTIVDLSVQQRRK